MSRRHSSARALKPSVGWLGRPTPECWGLLCSATSSPILEQVLSFWILGATRGSPSATPLSGTLVPADRMGVWLGTEGRDEGGPRQCL